MASKIKTTRGKKAVTRRKIIKSKRITAIKKKTDSSYPAKLAIIVAILVLSFFIGLFLIGQKRGTFQNKTTISVNSVQECKNHAYQGDAEIKGWLVTKDGKEYIGIPKEEMSKLPKNETTEKHVRKNEDKKIVAVDMKPELKDVLNESSEDNKKSIKITGFATTCRGEMLASLDYKEGIFRQYLY